MTTTERARTNGADGAAPGSARGSGRRGSGGRTGIVAVIAVAVLVAGAIVVWASPVLGLRSVDVVGARTAETVAAVIDAAGVPEGTPLARIDVDAVRQRVAAVDAVADVTVNRHWPHAVTVTVTERAPVAMTQGNGLWWSVDATGHLFHGQSERPANLMPLELATPGPADLPTAAALGVLRSLSPQVRGLVVAVVAATEYSVTLRLADGRVVRWGSDEDAPAKNAVVPAVLAQPGTVFDVSDPTLVTVSDG